MSIDKDIFDHAQYREELAKYFENLANKIRQNRNLKDIPFFVIAESDNTISYGGAANAIRIRGVFLKLERVMLSLVDEDGEPGGNNAH